MDSENPLNEILEGLRGIARLEQSLKEATDRFSGELDLVKNELVQINEAKKLDSVEIVKLNKTVNAIKLDFENIAVRNEATNTRVDTLDNTSNKNKEKITKLESRVDKLEDMENSLRILKEQERRKNMETILKTQLQAFNTDKKKDSNSDNLKQSTLSSTDFSKSNKTPSFSKPEIGEDILAEARKVIGLYPVKPRHILKWNTNEYSPCEDDIPSLEEERRQAALYFLHLELKFTCKDPFQTKWSPTSNTLWVTFDSETIVNTLYMAQSKLGNNNIKLLKFTPPWIYNRNRELEILCRKARETDTLLRTKISLGHTDLVLKIKRKGERFYKTIAVDSFGPLPPLEFQRNIPLSPGSPLGRSPVPDDNHQNRKRNRDDSSSPILNSKLRKPSVHDMSYDSPNSNQTTNMNQVSIFNQADISNQVSDADNIN